MLEENFVQKKANIRAAHKEENLILVISWKKWNERTNETVRPNKREIGNKEKRKKESDKNKKKFELCLKEVKRSNTLPLTPLPDNPLFKGNFLFNCFYTCDNV